jgi:hypothetical protein
MIPLVFFLSVTAVIGVGSLGSTYDEIQDQIDALNCPMPQLQGSPFPFPDGTQRTNATYNTRSAGNQTLTLTCTPVHTFKGYDYHYGEPTVAIGIIFFPFDYISEAVHKLVTLFVLIGIGMTPPDDIPANVKSLIFLFIYVPMYVLFGFGIYKGVSPFA